MEEIKDTVDSNGPNLEKFRNKFTLDGSILVEIADGVEIEKPLKTVDILLTHPKLKESHICEMKLFHSLLLTIKKNHPRRLVPITKKELFRAGADKRLISDLIDFGYLSTALIPLVRDGGIPIGAHTCYFYTPEGRALIRAKLDPNYAKTEYK